MHELSCEGCRRDLLVLEGRAWVCVDRHSIGGASQGPWLFCSWACTMTFAAGRAATLVAGRAG